MTCWTCEADLTQGNCNYSCSIPHYCLSVAHIEEHAPVAQMHCPQHFPSAEIVAHIWLKKHVYFNVKDWHNTIDSVGQRPCFVRQHYSMASKNGSLLIKIYNALFFLVAILPFGGQSMAATWSKGLRGSPMVGQCQSSTQWRTTWERGGERPHLCWIRMKPLPPSHHSQGSLVPILSLTQPFETLFISFIVP